MSCDGAFLYLECGGGYMNVHMRKLHWTTNTCIHPYMQMRACESGEIQISFVDFTGVNFWVNYIIVIQDVAIERTRRRLYETFLYIFCNFL